LKNENSLVQLLFLRRTIFFVSYKSELFPGRCRKTLSLLKNAGTGSADTDSEDMEDFMPYRE
jgi:hypothetical protein